ncbi:Voltage-dependent anion-selective channel protein 1 [Sparganum proliferum]
MTYDTISGCKGAFIRNNYKNTSINAHVDLALKSVVPDVSASCVIGQRDYLLGFEAVWDPSSNKLTRANATVAYSVDDFTFYGSISNWAKVYSAGVYQKLTDRVSYAGETSWTRGLPDLQWAIGLKLILDDRKNQVLKSKVDSQSRVSFSYKSKLTKNVKVILSAEVSKSAPTLMGLGIELER